MRELTRNIEGCANNPYQRYDKFKRVLTVCSGGCLRSPTAAVVLAGEPYNYNTRSCGLTEEFAIIALDDVLFNWADEIVVMEQHQANEIKRRYPNDNKPIVVLNIQDRYSYRDEKLIALIKKHYVSTKSTVDNVSKAGYTVR